LPALLLLTLLSWSALRPVSAQPPPAVIVLSGEVSPRATLAAREVRRYVFACTGELLPSVATPPATGDAILLRVDPALGCEEYRLKTIAETGRRLLHITGGSDLALLYGAYAFAGHLGARFEVHGDELPATRLPFRLPALDEQRVPLFATRGIQPFHDFTEGPDWWEAEDYQAYLAQLVKMRMNFAGFHCYPEGGVGPEPLIWIGLPEELEPDGRVKASYPSRWASTLGGAWGYEPTKTSEFAAGAGLLFEDDDFGPSVTRGHRPKPTSPAGANEVFRRTAALLGKAFGFGRSLGVQIGVGTETPLTIPKEVRARLVAQGLDPAKPETVRRLYEGMFRRLAATSQVDYYWLWTPEDWTWGGNRPEQYAATLADIRAAQSALDTLGRPFTLATSGWVLGPQHDRAALDRDLPRTSPMSCINQLVGFQFVEPAFARIEGRPKWAIPWLEDDPNLVGVQLFAGRTRRDAADAHAYGCTGLLGIHWRTKVLSPNFSALAQAAWSQRPWNPDFGQRLKVEPRTSDVREGGNVASFPNNPIADTEADAIYQTCIYALNGYRVKVPNGTYTVTLQFAEVHYEAAGKRVFGVALQGKPVLEHLDVFGRSGKNKALDCTYTDIVVTNEELHLTFMPEIEFPFIAGLVIAGRTAGANQAEGAPFTRRINCGGPAVAGYEADLPEAGSLPGRTGVTRDLPCDDFYADWARAQFGAEIAQPMAELFVSLDGGAGDYSRNQNEGTRLPRPSDWIGGPGGIKPNAKPWSEVAPRYAFVERMAALRPQVRGELNLDRFDYWLNTFRYHRALGQLGCTRGELDRIVSGVAKEREAAKRLDCTQTEALPVRLALARQWEEMMTFLLQTVSTPGELGTIANLEQHSRRNPKETHFLEKHDAQLSAWLGAPLPAEAQPATTYQGPARLIVPTVPTVLPEGEKLSLKVIVLDREPPQAAAVFWRALGAGEFRQLPLRHVARGVHRAELPALGADGLEYYVRAVTAAGQALVWPVSAPGLNQTVVALPAGK
jgi:hypothetical protein